MDYDEFVACCLQCQAKCDPSELPYVYTADDLEALAEALDRAKSGRINYLAFAGLFGRGRQTHAAGGEDSRGAGAAAEANARNAVVQHICTTLWANDVVLHKAFRCFDPDGSGRMDVAEFARLVADLDAGQIKSQREVVPQRARAAFVAFDDNRSGFLNARELRHADVEGARGAPG